MKYLFKKLFISAFFANLLILNAQDQNIQISNSNEQNWNFIRENFQKSKYKDYKILISTIIGYWSGTLAFDITHKKLRDPRKSYLSFILTSLFSTLFSYELIKKLNDTSENQNQLKLLLSEDIIKFPAELRKDIEKLREIIRTLDQETKKNLIQGIYRKISSNLDETSKRIDFALLLKPIEINNLIDYRSKLLKEDPSWKFVHDNIVQSLKQKVGWGFVIGTANTLLSVIPVYYIFLWSLPSSPSKPSWATLVLNMLSVTTFLTFFNSNLEKAKNQMLENKEISILLKNEELLPETLKSYIENLKEAINNKNKDAIKVILTKINNKIDENLKDCSLKNRFINKASIFTAKLAGTVLTSTAVIILLIIFEFELWKLIYRNEKSNPTN